MFSIIFLSYFKGKQTVKMKKNYFQNILIVLLIVVILYSLVKLNNLYSAPTPTPTQKSILIEGFYSDSKSKKMRERFKVIKKRNKDKFEKEKKEQLKEKFEPDKIPSLADSFRNSSKNMFKTKNGKKLNNPIAESYRKKFDNYSKCLNEGILGRKSKNLKESFEKFDKLKDKFWEIFERK